MITSVFAAIVFAGALLAGLLGALTGLGGGVVVIPLLVVGLGVDLRYAIGASLVSVMATSAGAACRYLREGLTNPRVAMFLLVATTLGALAGSALVTVLSKRIIAGLFGGVLLWSAWLTTRRREEFPAHRPSDPLAVRLRMEGTVPSPDGPRPYRVFRLLIGFGLMLAAGALSGLLGIGSGALKVLAMDQGMGLPYKVSTATSNFMVGVTAAASAGVYLGHGYIQPGIALPVLLGVLLGAVLGARVLVGARSLVLRRIFALTVAALALDMLYKAVTGSI